MRKKELLFLCALLCIGSAAGMNSVREGIQEEIQQCQLLLDYIRSRGLFQKQGRDLVDPLKEVEQNKRKSKPVLEDRLEKRIDSMTDHLSNSDENCRFISKIIIHRNSDLDVLLCKPTLSQDLYAILGKEQDKEIRGQKKRKSDYEVIFDRFCCFNKIQKNVHHECVSILKKEARLLGGIFAEDGGEEDDENAQYRNLARVGIYSLAIAMRLALENEYKLSYFFIDFARDMLAIASEVNTVRAFYHEILSHKKDQKISK